MSRNRRWDFLFEQKPVTLVDHVLGEVAKLLSAGLRQWPLPVQDLDLATGREFAPLLEPGNPRPGEPVFREAYRLARWELEREFEAQDDYVRNRQYLAFGVREDERTALLFIKRWVEEQLLAVLDATGGRIKRKDLVKALNKLS